MTVDRLAMSTEPMRVETDVLVIGSGAAGMYAAIEAARAGCRVLLIDRSLIGRGGATVMAQMTVAVARGGGAPRRPPTGPIFPRTRSPQAGGSARSRCRACFAKKARPASRRWIPGV